MTSPYTAVNEVRTTLRDDLIAAKALIVDASTWVKHPGAVGECYCAVTTLTGVFAGKPNREIGNRKRAAWDALAAALPEGWRTVSSYNDDPTTTHADIMSLFDRAIASAESSS